MNRSNQHIDIVITITTAGFAATIAQILVLRELLVLFYGSEITAGIIFACWLLWTALGSGLVGKWYGRITRKALFRGALLALLGAMLPLVLMLIRAARLLWSIPYGELPAISDITTISIAATGLFCPLGGALFGICWFDLRQNSRQDGPYEPFAVYIGEALGAALGGLAFYYALIPLLSACGIASITAVLTAAMSAMILRPWRLPGNGCLGRWAWMGICIFIALFAVFQSDIDTRSRRWQWGDNLVAVRDTAYHNIAIVQKENQISVMTNGLWLFSAPDRLSTELAVHPALLQHPNPRAVLLLGGGTSGRISEVLKYQEIVKIDVVEPDPELIGFISPWLTGNIRNSMNSARVLIHHSDAGRFIRRGSLRYDVILMDAGDPMNAQTNRFYTKEFFDQLHNRLKPGGIFSFAVTGGADMLGQTQARFVSGIRKTLSQAFPQIVLLPGDQMRFIATNTAGKLSTDYRVLSKRISEKHLDLAYVREDTLQETLNPLRQAYVRSILDEFKKTPVNFDFSPTCYFHNMILWGLQWHASLAILLDAWAGVKPLYLWVAVGVLALLVLGLVRIARLSTPAVVSVCVMFAGAMGMVILLVLLLVFQVLEGFVYLQLALIIACFMAGLGIGSGWTWQRYRAIQSGNKALSYLIRIQAVMCLFPLFLLWLFTLIHGSGEYSLTSSPAGWLFSTLSFATGIVGGMHFSVAVMAYAAAVKNPETGGGKLYAWDLAGSAGGVLVASFFILPVFGLHQIMLLLCAFSIICLLALLFRY